MTRKRPGDSSLRLTERMWFEAQLSLAGLKASKTQPYAVIYTFDVEGGTPVRCWIGVRGEDGLAVTDPGRDAKARELVAPRFEEVRQALAGLPGLTKDLDLATDVVFEISIHTDYVNTLLCRIQGDTIAWVD